MYGYIYKTTNLINNKIYIGQHHSNKHNDKYIGSGTTFLKALKKYGFNNFKSEIIDYAEAKEELDKKEIYWIEYYNSRNRKIGYNIAKGGIGGIGGSKKGRKFCTTARLHIKELRKGSGNPMFGKHMSEETKKKISNSNKGRKVSEQGRKNISNGHKGLRVWNKGIHYSKEKRKEMSLKHLNKKWIYKNNITKQINQIEIELYLKDGWKLGRKGE